MGSVSIWVAATLFAMKIPGTRATRRDYAMDAC